MNASLRTFLVDGERRRVAFGNGEADGDIAFAYAVAADLPRTWTSLGATPFLERPLRFAGLRLLAPFGGTPKDGFREIFVKEPRFGRLWGRFSVDVPVAIERAAKLFDNGLFRRLDEGYRVFVMEDGERYATRAMCVFRTEGDVGTVVELLHDRSLTGIRNASHLLGLALRAMHEAGANVARAAAFPHSGTIPAFMRHGFRRPRNGRRVFVQVGDPAIAELVTKRENWYVSYLDTIDELAAVG